MTKYLNETSKEVRYDKIQSAIEEQIHKLADEYTEKHGTLRVDDEHGEYRISETQLDDEAYEWACSELLDRIDNTISNDELYWIVDVMLNENFGHEPHPKNPYAVRKKTVPSLEPTLTAELTPFGIMFNIK